MLHLILVRHGETDWNAQRRYQGQTDIDLSETGRQQAAALADRLAGQQIDAAYSSDLRRAWETAAAILGAQADLPAPEPRLREIGLGLLEGLTFEEAQARYPETVAGWLSDPDRPPEGGEPYSTFSARIQAFLDHLRQTHHQQTVLAVSHAGPIREILRLALGLSPAGHWYFEIAPASISELRLYPDQPVLIRLNDTCHPSQVDRPAG